MAERLQKELASVQSASHDISPQNILDSLLEETQVKSIDGNFDTWENIRQ